MHMLEPIPHTVYSCKPIWSCYFSVIFVVAAVFVAIIVFSFIFDVETVNGFLMFLLLLLLSLLHMTA